MIFDTETAILARLSAKLAPGSTLLGTFDPVDLTDDASTPVVGKVMLLRILDNFNDGGPTSQITLAYTFDVYVDIYRASPTQKSAAAQMLQDAGNALVGWISTPGRITHIVDGQDSGFDGRILRLSIGFTIPAYFVGS